MYTQGFSCVMGRQLYDLGAAQEIMAAVCRKHTHHATWQHLHKEQHLDSVFLTENQLFWALYHGHSFKLLD